MNAAEIQRALEDKYGITWEQRTPWWIDFASVGLHIDDDLAPVGTELVFKGATNKIICGAGLIVDIPAGPTWPERHSAMRYSPTYGNDPYVTRRTGKITGLTWRGNPNFSAVNEEVLIFNGQTGIQYDYHPIVIYKGTYAQIFLTQLWTLGA